MRDIRLVVVGIRVVLWDIQVVLWDIRVVLWDIQVVGVGDTAAWDSHQLKPGKEEGSAKML